MVAVRTLNIPFETIIVHEAPHSAKAIYEAEGLRLMQFHADNFAVAEGSD